MYIFPLARGAIFFFLCVHFLTVIIILHLCYILYSFLLE